MEFFEPLLQRNLIIALAVGGGVVAVVGSYLSRGASSVDPQLARFVLRSGYAISWASVAFFIAAGFFGS